MIPLRLKAPLWLVGVGAALLLAMFAIASQLPPTTRTLDGSLTLRHAVPIGAPVVGKDYPCVGVGGFDDIRGGATVVVYDAADKILAMGRLDPGRANDATGDCIFLFAVPDVPTSDFYRVEVAHRGQVPFTQRQVDDHQVQLTLG